MNSSVKVKKQTIKYPRLVVYNDEEYNLIVIAQSETTGTVVLAEDESRIGKYEEGFISFDNDYEWKDFDGEVILSN